MYIWLSGCNEIVGEHLAADTNYINKEFGRRYSPILAACENDQLDIVKYLGEKFHADIKLPDGGSDITEKNSWLC